MQELFSPYTLLKGYVGFWGLCVCPFQNQKSGNTKRRLASAAPRRSLKDCSLSFSGTGAITQLRNPGLIRSAKMSGATIRIKDRAKPEAEGRALSCCRGGRRSIGIDHTFDVPFDRSNNRRIAIPILPSAFPRSPTTHPLLLVRESLLD